MDKTQRDSKMSKSSNQTSLIGLFGRLPITTQSVHAGDFLFQFLAGDIFRQLMKGGRI